MLRVCLVVNVCLKSVERKAKLDFLHYLIAF